VTLTSQDNTVATVTDAGNGNWTVHIVSAGTVTIEATQAGDGLYAIATPVDELLTINQATQTITFPQPFVTGIGLEGGTAILHATASSGLIVTYGESGPATIINNQITLTGVGTVIVTALQAGSLDYLPAPPVSDTIQVFAPGSFVSGIGIFPNPVHGTMHIRMTQNYQITKLIIFDIRGRIVLGMDQFEGQPTDIPVNITGLTPGIYLVRVVCIRDNQLVYPVFKIEVQ
jgi:hypothetical protein